MGKSGSQPAQCHAAHRCCLCALMAPAKAYSPGTQEASRLFGQLALFSLLQCSSGIRVITRADSGELLGAITGMPVLGGSWGDFQVAAVRGRRSAAAPLHAVLSSCLWRSSALESAPFGAGGGGNQISLHISAADGFTQSHLACSFLIPSFHF